MLRPNQINFLIKFEHKIIGVSGIQRAVASEGVDTVSLSDGDVFQILGGVSGRGLVRGAEGVKDTARARGDEKDHVGVDHRGAETDGEILVSTDCGNEFDLLFVEIVVNDNVLPIGGWKWAVGGCQ